MANKEKILAAAQKYLQKNNLVRAIKEYVKVVELDAKDVRSRQKLAELYSRTSKTEEALTHYAAVAAYYAENTFYLKAIAVYKQMQRLAPDDPSYTLQLAQLNEQQGLIGNALAEYRVLLAGYEKLQEHDNAVEILNKMRELDPENITIGMQIAEFYAHVGNVDSAHAEFAVVEKKLITLGNYQQLSKLYEKFMKVWPDDLEIKLGYGRAMVDYGEPIGGVEYLTQLQRQHPKDVVVLFTLSAGFRACSDYKHELECLERVVEWQPTSVDYLRALYRAAFDADEADKAFKYLEHSKDLFIEQKLAAELKPYYEKLRDLFPDNRDVLTSLHEIYEQLGEGEKLFDVISSELTTDTDDYSANFGGTVEGDSVSFDELAFAGEQPAADDQDISFDDISFNMADESSDGGDDDFDFDLNTSDTSGVVDIQTDLEEADFYLQQGLLEEAQQVCDRLEAASPENESILALKEQILQRRAQGSAGSTVAPLDVANDPVDIEFDDNSEVVLDLDISEFDTDFEEPLGDNEFNFTANDTDIETSLSELHVDQDVTSVQPELADSQRGVVTVITDEDTESSYNLGIAYKEMGLLDDAIVEFDKAMTCTARKVDCLSLKAACYIDKQDFASAEDVLTVGLSDGGLSPQEQVILYYETGLLYEAWDRFADALSSYQVVADNDSSFRDVGLKIMELKELVDGENGTAVGVSRVSYL